MLGGFFMSINIENMEKPKCAKIFWQMQKQFRLTTMICIECKKALDDDTLSHCSDCGQIMRNRIDCFCDLRKHEPVKTPTITEIMAQSYVGRLEQQNKDLKQQLYSAKEEISSHLEALEVSKDWHSKQRQQLLDKVQRLETEVE